MVPAAVPPDVRVRARAGALLAVVLAASPVLRADWRTAIGYDRLNATFPTGVPTAVTTGVTQVEAADVDGNFYLPETTHSAFAAKTIIAKSPGRGGSGHATAVGGIFYGNSGSLLPGTTTVDAYDANTWLQSAFLLFGTTGTPLVETRAVQNHSWIAASGLTSAQIIDLNARLDYAIDRDGFVCVVGVNNGQSTTLPQLMAQGYNTLSVGLTNGSHSAGFTDQDGAGRPKPELVAPDSVTSFATPQVAGTAGLLVEKLRAAPAALTGADLPRVTKALLLAGATKDEIPGWAHTAAQPLDLRYGAGQVNALLSYRMLVAGRATPSMSGTAADTGWAATTLTGGAQHTYFFDVPAGAASPRFSAALVWHRLLRPANPGFWLNVTGTLTNLDLQLFTATGFTPGTLLDASTSSVGTLEHLYPPSLAPGRYALVVTLPAGSPATAYALAWRTLPTVALTTSTAEARELDGTPGVITFTRTGPTTSPLWVPLTIGGTALPATHYTGLPAAVLFPAGVASAVLNVAPLGDALAQGDRTVTVSIASDFSLSASATAAAATVTVRDKPFDAWRAQHFPASTLADATTSGPLADPDGDGAPNLLEYAFDGAPAEPDAAATRPVQSTVDGHLALTYFRPDGRDDLAYTVEWSTDLATWTSDASAVEPVEAVAVTGGTRITARAAVTTSERPRQFLRVRVARP